MDILVVVLFTLALLGLFVPYAVRSGYLGYVLLRLMTYRYHPGHSPHTLSHRTQATPRSEATRATLGTQATQAV